MDILIFAGQSNMQGSTECRPIEKPTEGVFEYMFYTDSIIPLNHPVGENFLDKNGQPLLLQSHNKNGSLVPYFCREYTKRTGRKVMAIHTAKGDSVIQAWQPQTERYALAKDKIIAGINKAKQIEKVGHIYLIWLQGESDAFGKTTAKDYVKGLINFKNALKKDVGIEKFGIIKVGYFASVVSWLNELSNEEYKKLDERIMRAQERAVKTDKDFVMLTRVCKRLSTTSKYINPEAEGHYNNNAMKIIGRKSAKTLADL